MTAPLTPTDCDLQDFPFMPLHVARLRDSDLANEETAEACWYAVLLWAASWHQIPAASLPDNDAILARLIGLGKDVRTFRKHKAGALRGFVLCDDGRLYHPVVAEQALTAWTSKLQQRWRTECARIKKLNQRHHTDHAFPTFDEFMSPGYAGPSPQAVPGDMAASPQGQSIQETGTGTGILREGSDDPSLSAGKPPRAGRKGTRQPIDDGFPGAEAMALAEQAVVAAGVALDVRDQAKRFRTHAVSTGRLLVDWPAAWLGWIEVEIGKAPAKASAPEAAPPPVWDGPEDVTAAVAEAMGQDYARGYLQHCRWQDGPVKAILAPMRFAADQIRTRAGPHLQQLGVSVLFAEGRVA